MTPTVLIVDDDEVVARTFSDWLRLEGYQVRTARDGEEALRIARGADAIVLDLRMPIVDGLTFLRTVRKSDNRAPIAIVTGDYLIDEGLLTELKSLNAQVLFKPLWVDDLVRLATTMVEQGVPA